MQHRIILPKSRSAGFSERDDFVVSSRVRYARNVDALPFPDYLPIEQKNKMDTFFKDICQNIFGERVRIFDTSQNDAKVLQNYESDLLITGSFSQFGDLFFADSQGSWVLLPNEKDHLRLFSIEYGSSLRDMVRRLDIVLKKLENKIHFAFTSDFGYLTAYADDAGTGLSLSYLLNLSGIELKGQTASLTSACEETGYHLTPYTGIRGSQFYFLRNISAFGASEDEMIHRFQDFTDKIWAQERLCREQLFASAEDMDFIHAQVMDAVSSQNLSYHNCLEAISLVDVLLGRPVDSWRALIFELHPHNRQFNQCTTKEEIEGLRAQLFRRTYQQNVRLK